MREVGKEIEKDSDEMREETKEKKLVKRDKRRKKVVRREKVMKIQKELQKRKKQEREQICLLFPQRRFPSQNGLLQKKLF